MLSSIFPYVIMMCNSEEHTGWLFELVYKKVCDITTEKISNILKKSGVSDGDIQSSLIYYWYAMSSDFIFLISKKIRSFPREVCLYYNSVETGTYSLLRDGPDYDPDTCEWVPPKTYPARTDHTYESTPRPPLRFDERHETQEDASAQEATSTVQNKRTQSSLKGGRGRKRTSNNTEVVEVQATTAANLQPPQIDIEDTTYDDDLEFHPTKNKRGKQIPTGRNRKGEVLAAIPLP